MKKQETYAKRWFAFLLKELENLKEERATVFKEAQARYDAEQSLMFSSRFGKMKKFNRDLIRDDPEYKALVDRYTNNYTGLAHVLYMRYADDITQIEFVLSQLAEHITLRPEKEWTQWTSVSETRYSTQGWGANKYAKNHAESEADTARYFDIPVEVRERYVKYDPPIHSHYNGTSYGYHEYDVVVALGQFQLEVLKRKPGITMKETVRLLWKRGVNPRVYYPFLPQGYEEKVGLDHFGNEVSATA